MPMHLHWTTTPGKNIDAAKARAQAALKKGNPSGLTKLELAFYNALKK